MKICLVTLMNLKHSSLLSLYTDYFDAHNIRYDIVYADKYMIEEETNAENIYKYEIKIVSDDNILQKIYKYFKFSNFVKKVFSKNKYDFTIIWRTETALLLFPLLILSKNKYILNIRDYCYENNKIIYLLVKKLVKSSLFTTISSPGFLEFLPNNDYIFVNSLNPKIIKASEKTNNDNEPIKISFIGYVRFLEEDKKLIKCFANDSRFKLQYIGNGSERLSKFIEENSITNVELVDGFNVNETSKYLGEADIINNLYGKNKIELDTAISTRYYHSLIYNLPILVYTNTYMSKITTSTHAFKVENINKFIPDEVFEWYKKIDFTILKKENDKKIKEINKQNEIFYTKLDEVFNQGRLL